MIITFIKIAVETFGTFFKGLFLEPFKMLYQIIMQYMVETDLDPLSFCGLFVCLGLSIWAVTSLVSVIKLSIRYVIIKQRKKKYAAQLEKDRQKAARRKEWEKSNQEFDELYRIYGN